MLCVFDVSTVSLIPIEKHRGLLKKVGKLGHKGQEPGDGSFGQPNNTLLLTWMLNHNWQLAGQWHPKEGHKGC